MDRVDVELMLDVDLVEKARSLGLDLEKIVDAAICAAIKEERDRRAQTGLGQTS